MKKYLILNGINPFLTIYFMLLSAEYFGLKIFGEVVFYQAIITIIAIILNLQNWSIVYDNQNNKDLAIRYSYKSDLKQNFLGVLISVFFFIYGFKSGEYFIIVLALLLWVNSFTSITAELRLSEHIVFLSLYRLPSNVLRILILINMELDVTIINLSLLLVIPELLNFLILIIYKRFIAEKKLLQEVQDESSLNINRAAYKSSLIDLPVTQLDTVIVGLLVNNEGVGIYKIIKSILLAMQVFLRPIIDWVAPVIVKEPKTKTFKIKISILTLCIFIYIFLNQKNYIEIFMGIMGLTLPQLFFDNVVLIIVSIFPFVYIQSINKFQMYGLGLHNTDVKLILSVNVLYLLMIYFFTVHFDLQGSLLSLLIQMIFLNIARHFFIKQKIYSC